MDGDCWTVIRVLYEREKELELLIYCKGFNKNLFNFLNKAIGINLIIKKFRTLKIKDDCD